MISNDNIIQLRGHHLFSFASYIREHNPFYYLESDFSSLTADLIKTQIDFLSFHQTKKTELQEWFASINILDFPDEYGGTFLRDVDNLWNHLMKKQQSKVIFVEGLDDICMNCPKAPNISELCYRPTDSNEDQFALKLYGFEHGKTYTIQEVINGLANFRLLTGYSTPRGITLGYNPAHHKQI
jgi:hypothetical protein